ncbi:unnamed protein product [Pneumocystis jirovecii]|uniref:Dystroglycan-type cadherin-like domain-containing protein n=1 Tax=Pneumocystis jirovecii TaxID=42068 RepID=L0PEB5_PNEJI|nr:unnamed protein product [Pneumocystis jirovecii]
MRQHCRQWVCRVWVFLWAAGWLGIGRTTPTVGFPVNSQVPPVARVSQQFSFTFSKNTFKDTNGEVKYAVSALPSWLNFNAKELKFYGVPSVQDIGVVKFALTATDALGSGVDQVTFVVVNTPEPTLKIPMDRQLRQYGGIDGKGALVLRPGQAFSFSLKKDMFDPHGNNILTYYCVSENNTPLPSWVKFDPEGLRIWGEAPPHEAVAPPLHFFLKVVAVDVIGFSGAEAPFGIAIGPQHLQLDRSYYSVDMMVGHSFTYPLPLSSLTRGGKPISPDEVSRLKITVSSPHWVLYDASNHVLVGTPSADDVSGSVLVTIMDEKSYKITMVIDMNVIKDSKAQVGIIEQKIPCFSSETGTGYKAPFLPDVFLVVDKPFSFQIGDPSSLSSFDKVDVLCTPKEALDWLKFNRHTMRLSGTPPREGNVSIRVHTVIYSSGHEYDQYFMDVTFDIDTEVVGKTSSFSAIIALAIVIPIVLIIFFFILYLCISRRVRRARLSPSGQRYISRPILPDARYGQWPAMDERTWDEPQRLSAFDIFKSTSANGLSGFVAEVKETPANTNLNTNSNTTSKKYQKTNFVSPYSIRMLPIKEDTFKEAPAYVPKEVQPLANGTNIPPQPSIGPPGYGMPHRSWRRTTLSSSFWPGNHDYHDRKVNAGSRTASTSEPFTVKLVSGSTSNSESSSGVISNVACSSTPSYNSSKESSGKSNDSKVTIGSYSDDSIASKGSENQPKESKNVGCFRKSDSHISKARPWSTQIDDADSVDTSSLISSEHSRNEFLYDENDDPRISSVNEHRSSLSGPLGASDSNGVQYRIATKVSAPLHACMQTPSKTDVFSTTPRRKGSLGMRSIMLDRPKMFEYSRPQKTSQLSRSLSTEGSSDMAFI